MPYLGMNVNELWRTAAALQSSSASSKADGSGGAIGAARDSSICNCCVLGLRMFAATSVTFSVNDVMSSSESNWK